MSYRIIATKFQAKSEYEVVREYSPCVRTINVDNRTYTLPFPYMVFYWTNPEVYLGFAKEPITSMDSVLYCPTIGNIFDYWRVCGCEMHRKSFGVSPLPEAVDIFWSSSFNYEGDLGILALHETFRKKSIKKKQDVNLTYNQIECELCKDPDTYKYWNKYWDGYWDDPNYRNWFGCNECECQDHKRYRTWSKLTPKQIIKRLYFNPRTFRNFLLSQKCECMDEFELEEDRMVHDLNLKLDAKHEQAIQIPPNLSSALVARNN